MTSFVIKEKRLEPFRIAFGKIALHQTEKILLVFDMAAINQFGNNKLSKKIMNELGCQETAKLSLDEFLAKVEAEIEKQPKPKQEHWGDVLEHYKL
jgi:hypothetical protein